MPASSWVVLKRLEIATDIPGKGRPLLEDRNQALLFLISSRTSKGDSYCCSEKSELTQSAE